MCEQPPYSIVVRGIERAVLPTCARYGIGVIPWSPLAGGLLTGRYRKGQPRTGRIAARPAASARSTRTRASSARTRRASTRSRSS